MQRGLVHADIAPRNILLEHVGRAAIRLIDFGVSCDVTTKPESFPKVIPSLDHWRLVSSSLQGLEVISDGVGTALVAEHLLPLTTFCPASTSPCRCRPSCARAGPARARST